MCRRTASRIAFGARLSDQTVTQERIDEASIMIERGGGRQLKVGRSCLNQPEIFSRNGGTGEQFSARH